MSSPRVVQSASCLVRELSGGRQQVGDEHLFVGEYGRHVGAAVLMVRVVRQRRRAADRLGGGQ